MTAEDLILVNSEGKVVDGGPIRLLNAAGQFYDYRLVEIS